MDVGDHGGALPGPRAAPMRFLGVSDVASLIINKVFGTGIFTAPVAVLLYTQSRWAAFLLWLCGLTFTWGRYVLISRTMGVI